MFKIYSVFKEEFAIGIQERKEREKAKMREKILQAAVEIMKSEGVEKLSIRKLAEKIEYSPAIVYHYFRDKEDIIDHIISNRYQQFLNALPVTDPGASTPLEHLLNNLRRFITLALAMENEYKTLMLNGSSAVLARTAVLHRGAAADRRAIGMMRDSLREIMKDRASCDDTQLELTAQIIWASIFGLVMRMNTEQIDPEQKERLICRLLDFIAGAVDTP